MLRAHSLPEMSMLALISVQRIVDQAKRPKFLYNFGVAVFTPRRKFLYKNYGEIDPSNPRIYLSIKIV